MKIKKLKWSTTQKTVNELIPQEINPRKISDKQMSDLKKSLKKYDLVEIPAIDLDNKILAGHQRCLAMKILGRGDEVIDVRVPNRKLTKKESQQYLIASNKISGEWNNELLIKHFNFDLLLDSGFEDMELMEFWDQDDEVKNDDFDIEKELSNIKEPVTKLGDIITLGKHKIICGDSTLTTNIQKLCGKEKISMIYSDPVYNISVNYDKGIGGKQNYGGSVNDTRTFDEYMEFITQAITASLSAAKKNIHIFYYCDSIYIGLIQEVYRKLGIENKRVALWLKNGFSPVPSSAFNKAYEPVVYGTIGSPFLNKVRTKYHEVFNKEVGNGNDIIEDVDHLFDVWAHKRLPSSKYEHATSKPPELHERAILRCTKINDIIFDSFLGSGSTLIAAEQLGRRVYGCELEPTFCDLIIRRYEKLTRTKAIIEHAQD